MLTPKTHETRTNHEGIAKWDVGYVLWSASIDIDISKDLVSEHKEVQYSNQTLLPVEVRLNIADVFKTPGRLARGTLQEAQNTVKIGILIVGLFVAAKIALKLRP